MTNCRFGAEPTVVVRTEELPSMTRSSQKAYTAALARAGSGRLVLFHLYPFGFTMLTRPLVSIQAVEYVWPYSLIGNGSETCCTASSPVNASTVVSALMNAFVCVEHT